MHQNEEVQEDQWQIIHYVAPMADSDREFIQYSARARQQIVEMAIGKPVTDLRDDKLLIGAYVRAKATVCPKCGKNPFLLGCKHDIGEIGFGPVIEGKK